MKRQVEVVLPYLVHGNSGKWFIEYRCYNSYTDRIERYRIYKGFCKLESDPAREALAKQLINHYTRKLKSGWRPWDSEKYIYADETEYRNVSKSFGIKKKDFSHIRKYLSDFLLLKKKEVSPKSYESYQSKTRLFCQWMEWKGYDRIRIFEITDSIVRDFFTYLIDTRGLDKITILKYRQNIGQMFSFFKSRKLIERIPMDDLPKAKKIKDLAARPIMDNDIKEYLEFVAKVDPQMFLASLFQFFLCIRPGQELRLLKIGDIDFFNQVIYISLENGKQGARTVTMPDALLEICNSFKLSKYNREYYVFSLSGEPGPKALGKNFFTRKFAIYRDKLGFQKTYKFYSFKHTGAGKLLESGATIAEVKNHLGHTSVESTIHYIHRHFGEKSKKVLDFRPDCLNGFLK